MADIELPRKGITPITLLPILRSLKDFCKRISTLDLSENPIFREGNIKTLNSAKDLVLNSCNLVSLNLSRTLLTDSSANAIVRAISKNPLLSLNLSSNSLSFLFFKNLSNIFRNSPMLSLIELNLSNCKMGDRAAILILDSVLHHSDVECLNLSRNNLRFKTASYLQSTLKHSPPMTKLKDINLTYNSISQAMIASIGRELEIINKHELFYNCDTFTNLIDSNNKNHIQSKHQVQSIYDTPPLSNCQESGIIQNLSPIMGSIQKESPPNSLRRKLSKKSSKALIRKLTLNSLESDGQDIEKNNRKSHHSNQTIKRSISNLKINRDKVCSISFNRRERLCRLKRKQSISLRNRNNGSTHRLEEEIPKDNEGDELETREEEKRKSVRSERVEEDKKTRRDTPRIKERCYNAPLQIECRRDALQETSLVPISSKNNTRIMNTNPKPIKIKLSQLQQEIEQTLSSRRSSLRKESRNTDIQSPSCNIFPEEPPNKSCHEFGRILRTPFKTTPSNHSILYSPTFSAFAQPPKVEQEKEFQSQERRSTKEDYDYDPLFTKSIHSSDDDEQESEFYSITSSFKKDFNIRSNRPATERLQKVEEFLK